MKRVLCITAGLMGLCLLLTVGGLASVRARATPQPTMLVDAPDDAQPDKRTVYIAGFGSRLHRKLVSGYVGYVGRGWSPDAAWFVIIAAHLAVARTRPNDFGNADSNYQSLFGVSPDGQWAMYSQVNMDTYAYDLWRVPLIGGEPIPLLHISSAESYIELRGWSLDQRWMLLELNYGIRTEQQWLKLASGEVRPLVEWGDTRFLDWLGPINRDWQPMGLMGLGAVFIGINRLLTRRKKSA